MALASPRITSIGRAVLLSRSIAPLSAYREAERILLLENEPALVEVLGAYLRSEGYIVGNALVIAPGLQWAFIERPSLVILDLDQPTLRQSDVFARLRSLYDGPLIALTSWSQVPECERGADAFLRKPFSPSHVVASVRNALSRAKALAPTLPEDGVQCVGALEIDRAAHEVRRHGIRVPLTPTEYRIIETLATHVGCALSRAQLIERAGRDGEIYDRTLDRHVGNLRAKIEDDPPKPAYVLTVATIGYKLARAPC